MPRWRAVYVSVNKAACTSLKWLVADLQGESRERFHRSLSREVSRTMTIHRRSLWQDTPMAKWMTDDELAAISPDQGWFVFGVVRHPTARLFSAWQSKLLLREPWWLEEFGHEAWWPRVPANSEDIVEDWLSFVRALGDDPRQRIGRNRHFAPQRWMLAVDRMPYTRIYKTSEIPQLLDDFEHHLRGLGWEGNGLELPRANETPLPPIASLFPPEVLDVSRELYRKDFAAFGYDDVMPSGLSTADRYPESAVMEVGRLIERAERIGDLALRAREVRRRPTRQVRPPAPPRPTLVRSARRLARRVRSRLTAHRRRPAGTMRSLGFLAALRGRLAPARKAATPKSKTSST
jgi:Sulfotransferase family